MSFPSTDLGTSAISINKLLEQRKRLSLCFGTSSSDCTRVSLSYLDPTDPALSLLQEAMSSVTRADAPMALRSLLTDHPNITLLYWKKQDDTHRFDSPGDGACGWHTLAQAHHRHLTGSLLNLQTRVGLNQAADLLTELANHTLAPLEDASSIRQAIHYMRQKRLDGTATPLPTRYQLLSDHLTSHCHTFPTSLFIQIPADNVHSYLQMPHDPTRSWLQHYASTGESFRDGTLLLPVLPLKEIIELSTNALIQLSCDHYWLYPALPDERVQCDLAVDHLALSQWDATHGVSTPEMIPPLHDLPIPPLLLNRMGGPL